MKEIVHVETDGGEVMADGGFDVEFGSGDGSAGGGEILAAQRGFGLKVFEGGNGLSRIGLIDQRAAGDGCADEKCEDGSAVDDVVAGVDQRDARGRGLGFGLSDIEWADDAGATAGLKIADAFFLEIEGILQYLHGAF